MIRGIIVCLFLAVPVFGQVNLKLVDRDTIYHVGDIVEIDLVATTYAETQYVCCMDVLLGWDPGVLELVGHYDPDDQDWLLSQFWDTWDINARAGLGLPETDGDAMYSAWSQLGEATMVIPGTEMILPSAPEIEGEGYPYLTRIFDDEVNEITGELSGTQPSIPDSSPEPEPEPEPEHQPKGKRGSYFRGS